MLLSIQVILSKWTCFSSGLVSFVGSKDSRPDNREASKIYLDNDVWGRSYRRYCSVRVPHQL